MPFERAIIWGVVGTLIAFFAYFFTKPVADGLEAICKGCGVWGYISVFGSLLSILTIIAWKLKG